MMTTHKPKTRRTFRPRRSRTECAGCLTSFWRFNERMGGPELCPHCSHFVNGHSTREEHDAECRSAFRLTSQRAVDEHTAKWVADESAIRELLHPKGYESR